MAGDEFGERTEQPTDRRRAEAREKGNVARSTDLSAAGLMLAAAAAIYMFGMSITGSLAELLHAHLKGPAWADVDSVSVVKHAWNVMEFLGKSILPLMLMMAGAALLFNVVQIGFLVTSESLVPKFSRLSPLQGVKRIFSVRALAKLAASLGKLVVLIAIAAWFIWAALPEFLQTLEAEWMPDSLAVVGQSYRETKLAGLFALVMRDSLAGLGFQLAIALVLLAVLDFGFQRWKHEQDLRMTRQEVRDELKNMEGDPLTRQRRRDAHRKLAQARELAQVREADVVITNPTEIAVALKYDPEKMPAPIVIAKGKGELAARIRQIAAEHGVTIIERKPLAWALYNSVKVGQVIPLEMYEVFVEIMAYVYRLTGRTPPQVE